MFSDIPESVLIICVADYSQSILPFYGTVVEHIELFDDIQYRALSHYHEMKCLYLIRYISAIQQPNRKSKRKTLWTFSFKKLFTEHLLLQRRQCRQICSNAIGKINYAQEQHSQNAFYFGPNYRTSNILNKNHPPPPPATSTPKNILILSVNPSLD